MSVRELAAPRRRSPLEAPRRALLVGPHYDPDAFGRFSEGVARVIGTARFLVAQTVIVVVWISLNVAFPSARFDEYPFILLTLALSLQAAYAGAGEPTREGFETTIRVLKSGGSPWPVTLTVGPDELAPPAAVSEARRHLGAAPPAP